jgi:hypothetical protein
MEGIMGFESAGQYQAEGGCNYFYDEKRKTWMKICDVPVWDLPVSVKNKVREE